MRHTFCSLNLFLCYMLCPIKLSAEVFGTYNVINGFKQNNALQSQQPQPQPSPPTVTAPVAQPPPPVREEYEGTQETSGYNEEQPKQVNPPVIATATISPISAPQTAFNRLPINYNPLMARKIGLTSLMMSGMLYGLTMLPALIAITGASPLSGLFSSLGRRKRSLVNESHIFRQLPLLDNEETYKFLTLFESTLASRKIESPGCKKYYTCKVFYSVMKSGEKPKLAVFENAIINVFGIAVERKDYRIQLIPTVKMYYNVAKDALRGESCARRYPCPLQAHHYMKPGL